METVFYVKGKYFKYYLKNILFLLNNLYFCTGYRTGLACVQCKGIRQCGEPGLDGHTAGGNVSGNQVGHGGS